MPNFAAGIAEIVARWPDRPAIELVRSAGGDVETTTYRALQDVAGRVAGWLVSRGVVAGDRAAILADNDARWIAAYLGVLRIGAVAVPLDTAYAAKQVHTVLESSGARLLFTTPRYLATARAAVALMANGAPEI